MKIKMISSPWKRLTKHFLLIVCSLVLAFLYAYPTSSNPNDDEGYWEWDPEKETRVFVPTRHPRVPNRPPLAADSESSPNGVTTPVIEADPFDEWIYGWDWTIGSTVYVCVDSSSFAADPTNPSQCDLYDDSMTAYAPVWNPSIGIVDFDVWGLFDLQGGQYITMSDLATTKQHLVTNLTVTGADAATDEVTGTAAASTQVEVYEYDTFNMLLVAANGSGDWVADFSGTTDLVAGSSGDASQYDGDGDYTSVYWSVPNPIISALPVADRVHGYDWPEGATVHVCVDDAGFASDPTNPSQCDFHASTLVPPGEPWGTFINFDLSGSHDLVSGDYVAMTDSTTTKQHQVTNLTLTSADHQTDMVNGTADPASEVEVWVFDCTNCVLNPVANGSGIWNADFSSIGTDIQPGDNGSASQTDTDDDETTIYWSVPVYELYLPLIMR